MRMIFNFYESLSPVGLISVECLQLLIWLPVAFCLWRDYGCQRLLWSRDPSEAMLGRLTLIPVILPAVKMLMLLAITVEETL